MERSELKDRIKEIVLNSDRPIDVNHIAKEVECTWFLVYRMLMEIILDDIERNNPEVMDALPFRPLKTTKSMVFVPQT